ncbi:MAG: P-II family nitrogen regulator [Tissierellia bacterium]|nr:P-II family nitrogen regulator [Tissierellia bacterium]
MNLKCELGEFSLFTIIVDSGKASGMLDYCKQHQVTGGTILQGYGASKSRFLHFLELEDISREVLIMIVRTEVGNALHDSLEHDFKLNRKNHGIAFSTDVYKMVGCRIDKRGESMKGPQEMSDYEAVFVIVEMGVGDEVIRVAQSAGAKGATVIHARGSGAHETAKLYGITIEPEKEIVLMLIKRETVDDVIRVIRDTLDIEQPGRGILFVLDVARATGLIDDN